MELLEICRDWKNQKGMNIIRGTRQKDIEEICGNAFLCGISSRDIETYGSNSNLV